VAEKNRRQPNTPVPPDAEFGTVTVQKLQVMDSRGRPRIEMSAQGSGSPVIKLRDAQGHCRLELGVLEECDGNPSISLLHNGNIVAALTLDGLDGKPNLYMGLHANDGGVACLDNRGINLEINENSQPQLTLTGSDAGDNPTGTMTFWPDPDVNADDDFPFVSLADSAGNERAGLRQHDENLTVMGFTASGEGCCWKLTERDVRARYVAEMVQHHGCIPSHEAADLEVPVGQAEVHHG
jgi:hypothetical protein